MCLPRFKMRKKDISGGNSLTDMAAAMRARVALAQRLYVRIYLALLASLAIAAILFGIVAHIHFDPSQFGSSLDTFAEIAAEVLPPAQAAASVQQAALSRWHTRVHADLALYASNGTLIANVGRPLPPLNLTQTESGFLVGHADVFALKLPDQRWLLEQRPQGHTARVGLIVLLVLIALAVAIGAYPVVRRLTRRLERLQLSVESWGSGKLSTRVAVEGNDEVARLATSFNDSAARIEALVGAQKSLLANASHELRSPLTRIRMAVELLVAEGAPAIRTELAHNIAELDQLIDEVLLASRLDSADDAIRIEQDVDLTGLVAEECARINASVDFDANAVQLACDSRLMRRLIRNLLENAKRHGAGTIITVRLRAPTPQTVELDICDGGPGVPEAERERIFAPFYRLPGASESAGGVGLGLSLVRQIARAHGGDVSCVPNPLRGCCFRVCLPA